MIDIKAIRASLNEAGQVFERVIARNTAITIADWKLILTHTSHSYPEIYYGKYDELLSLAIDRKAELTTTGFSITSAKLIFKESKPEIDIINAI